MILELVYKIQVVVTSLEHRNHKRRFFKKNLILFHAMHIRSMVYRVQYLNQSISKDKLEDFLSFSFYTFLNSFSFSQKKKIKKSDLKCHARYLKRRTQMTSCSLIGCCHDFQDPELKYKINDSNFFSISLSLSCGLLDKKTKKRIKRHILDLYQKC